MRSTCICLGFTLLFGSAACSGGDELDPVDGGSGAVDMGQNTQADGGGTNADAGVTADAGEVDTGTPDAGPVDTGPSGLPVLGNGLHTPDSVVIDLWADRQEMLLGPRDLAFNPMAPAELWIVNLDNESTTVITDFGTGNQRALFFREASGHHFLARPSGMAFGKPGFWASIHETDVQTQGPNGTPADFMGPSLWTSDLNEFDAGHLSHYDMLHNTPNGMGIAWETGNTYWVFDGFHSSLTRYDFVADHGAGGTDHSDGIIARYAQTEVSRVPEVPSHMELDQNTGLLYVADTGNNRIATLDTAGGVRGSRIGPNYDGIDQYRMNEVHTETLVDGATVGLQQPSGLVLRDAILYIGDHATGRIHGFDLEGNELDYLDTGLGAGLMGMEMDQFGNLVVIHFPSDSVYIISPR